MDLNGSTVLVTGGAVRIGAAICRELGAAGCRVLVHYHRSAREAELLVEALEGLGVAAWAVAGELDTAAGCHALFERALSCAGGRVDLLVNNASLFTRETLAASTPESMAREFAVNLLAPMHLTRALAAALGTERASPACVINLLDRRIESNEGGCLPYLVSKKALADFTRVAAVELAPRVRVNGVAPGAILPPPGEGLAYLRDRAGTIPMEHRAGPRDIAAAVRFLATAEHVTGQILYIDGGQHLLGAGGTVRPGGGS